MSNKKTALVTGGAGFIGSNLAKKLVRENYEVTVVDNLTAPRNDFDNFFKTNSEIEFIPACFSSKEILSRITNKDFDYIFHNAAIPRVSYSVENPAETTDTNILRTVKLMEAAKGNITRFVFASSSSVYGGADVLPTKNSHPRDPKSPYAWQKSAIEDIAKIFSSLYELDIVCLRYFKS